MHRAIPSFAVIRLTKVAISRDALTEALGIEPDRYLVERDGPLQYAQINVPESDDPWPGVSAILSRLGAQIAALVIEQRIGSATLDLAFLFLPELTTRSSFIPSSIALAAGQSLIGIEVSTYPSDDADSGQDSSTTDQLGRLR